MKQLPGVSWLCGIGFTMSLFIGSRAFEHSQQAYGTHVRVGILVGSLLSAMAGYLVLRAALAGRHATADEANASQEVWSQMGDNTVREGA